jgi:hypothetical protein
MRRNKYNAFVREIISGDTIVCDINLGFDVSVSRTIKLAYVGQVNKFVEEILIQKVLNKDVILEDRGKSKKGDNLAVVYINYDMNMNDWLILNRFAVEDYNQ